jgi:hypothetical protein
MKSRGQVSKGDLFHDDDRCDRAWADRACQPSTRDDDSRLHSTNRTASRTITNRRHYENMVLIFDGDLILRNVALINSIIIDYRHQTTSLNTIRKSK